MFAVLWVSRLAAVVAVGYKHVLFVLSIKTLYCMNCLQSIPSEYAKEIGVRGSVSN